MRSDPGSFERRDTELTVVYDGEHPIVRLSLEANDRHAVVEAVVDSGAHRTLLPDGVADELGIGRRSRIRLDGRVPGGRRLKAWECETTVDAQVIVVQAGAVVFWGSRFSFKPSFAKIDRALAGRTDFFHVHIVTFEQYERLLRLRRQPEPDAMGA